MPPPPRPDLRAGQPVGDYVIEAPIGIGGFGAVYRATHPLIGKRVAIKVLARAYSEEPEMVSRFVAEARSVNQIRHRNIIDIFGFGQLADGRHYYVMELLEGFPLDVYLERCGRLALVEAVPILRAVARALDAAHAAGIVHRDIKPANIFLCEDPDGGWFPKLLDFGIAKAFGAPVETAHKTRSGSPMGTAYYMSPEQARGREIDHRTDVYAFGCVAYELLTGEVPYEADGYLQTLIEQINAPIPRVSERVPELAAVDEAIAAMMQKEPADRPMRVGAAMAALEQAATARGHVLPAIEASSVLSRLPLKPPPATLAGNLDLAVTVTDEAAAAPSAVGAAGPASAGVRRRWRWGALAVAVVALGLVAWGVARGRGGEPRPADRPAVAASTSPPPPPPPTPATVTVTVTGHPTGAVVTGPGGLATTLPGTLELPRGDRPVELTIAAPGFSSEIRTVVPGAPATVAVTLVAVRTAEPRRRPGRGGAEPDGGAPRRINPLLEDPFVAPR